MTRVNSPFEFYTLLKFEMLSIRNEMYKTTYNFNNIKRRQVFMVYMWSDLPNFIRIG